MKINLKTLFTISFLFANFTFSFASSSLDDFLASVPADDFQAPVADEPQKGIEAPTEIIGSEKVKVKKEVITKDNDPRL